MTIIDGIEYVEIRGSRTGTDATDRNSTAELVWHVNGSNSPDTVRDALVGVVPMVYDGLIYQSLNFEHLGNRIWEFRAKYVHPDRSDRDDTLDIGEYVFSFDTSGGTTTRFVSISTLGKYAKTGETAPDYKNSINVTRDGVEGVEIGIPALKLTIRKRVPRADITIDYVKLLTDMTYTVNNAPYLGFSAGELLFIGASGSQGTHSDPEVTWNFVASANVEGMTVGDITSVDKKGHEYLWVDFEDIEDATANFTVKQPRSCYVEQVYYSSNFNLLGI